MNAMRQTIRAGLRRIPADKPSPVPVHSPEDALEAMLRSYQRYYNINRETPMEPFAAEAVFSAHNEQYFLIKSAKWAEMDSNEYVFFATEEVLDAGRAEELAALAWEEGLRRTDPKPNHRNSDTILIVLCGKLTPEAAEVIRKTNPGRSYRFGLWGWSNFKWIAVEIPEGKTACNRHGQSLKNLVGKIVQP